jgi:hypothetical protein
VVEMEGVVVAAGKEEFRLACENRQNVVLISIYIVCFAEVGVAAVVEVAAEVAAVVEVAADESSQVARRCLWLLWLTVWFIRRHLPTYSTRDT